jgi:hypothetical protein
MPGPEDIYVQGAALTPSGDLLVTFQGHDIFPYQVGAALVDPAGRVLWSAGNLAVSLRSPAAILILDPATGRVKRVLKGPLAAQHSPVFLPDGTRILIGATLAGRIVEADLATGRVLWIREEVEAPGPWTDRYGPGPVRLQVQGAEHLSPALLDRLLARRPHS